jgi:predicted peptidase
LALRDPDDAVAAARTLAESQTDPNSAQYQAKGDQHRSYFFDEAGKEIPYRISVPSNWDGQSELPLFMFLYGSGSDENNYIDANNGQLITLCQLHGFLLVSPISSTGATNSNPSPISPGPNGLSPSHTPDRRISV